MPLLVAFLLLAGCAANEHSAGESYDRYIVRKEVCRRSGGTWIHRRFYDRRQPIRIEELKASFCHY